MNFGKTSLLIESRCFEHRFYSIFSIKVKKIYEFINEILQL